MILINNRETIPYYNLALEEYFFTNCQEEVIILWRNAPCVVIGKNQNTVDEIDQKYVEENSIPVIRRITGGGAVVHDLGNLNYTIIQNQSEKNFRDFKKFTKPVCDFLQELGVPAEVNGRNDIAIQGCKISGNAQAVKNGRVLHHGTLLYNADLTRVSRALKPNPVKYQSKAVSSVRSRVANIADFLEHPFSIEEFAEKLFQYFKETEESYSVHEISSSEKKVICDMAKKKYETWEWNYGESPKYDFVKCKRFESGTIEVRASIEKGYLKQVSIYGDFFGKKDKNELEEIFKGKKHARKDLEETLKNVEIKDYISGLGREEFIELLI